jgi:hypothetical protein
MCSSREGTFSIDLCVGELIARKDLHPVNRLLSVRFVVPSLFLFTSVLIAACGGGSSSNTSSVTPSATASSSSSFLSPTGSASQPLVISRTQGTVITVNPPASGSFSVGSSPSGCVSISLSSTPVASFTINALASAPANCTTTVNVTVGQDAGSVYVIVP